MGQTILKEDLVDDGEVPVYSATESGVIFGRIDKPKVQLNAGDIVIPARGVSIGYPVLIKERSTSTQTTIYTKLLDHKAVHTPYVYYFMSGHRNDLFYYDRTAIPQITVEQVESNPLLLPPMSEQRAIADFLDAETAKLDALMAKRRELIEKLKEKRSALISCTVTRGLPPDAARAAGLNPNPKPKPSGIEWLGGIPEHWDVVRIGRKITLQRGVDITKEEQNEGSVPVVSSGGISSFHDKALARGPGVIVGRKGTAGAVYYIESDFWPHDTTLWVREFGNNFPKYVYYKLCSMDLESFDTGSSNPTVNRNLVHPVRVSWPPEPEQRAIADYLDRETNKIDRMVTKVQEAIERLREYRIALITAAVTGKIDVRKLAA